MNDVRTIRTRLGVTQVELAGMLGLHQSTVSRLEKGMLPLDERTRLALEALEARRPGNSTATDAAPEPDAAAVAA